MFWKVALELNESETNTVTFINLHNNEKSKLNLNIWKRDLKTQRNRIGYQMQAFDRVQYTSFTKENLN